ncbi:MAG: prepilin-type N-terminal cleavage/methylation domain-containing protein [Desulfovibrionales bacterium]|nr:prepilin-type N-terminal cleavage/methylation domain-containing protein [Desulfovibrionales bacterium]
MKTSDAGFTLVEILLALSIFAALVSSLFLSFNTLVSKAPMASLLTDQEMASTAMERIMADFSSLCITPKVNYIPPTASGDDGGDRFAFTAGRQHLEGRSLTWVRFAAFAHLPFDQGDRDRIGLLSYGVFPSEDGDFVLKRRDRALTLGPLDDPPGGGGQILCDRVRAFDIHFIDSKGQVHSHWDSDGDGFGFATPRALRIHLVVGDGAREREYQTTLILPVFRESKEDS